MEIKKTSKASLENKKSSWLLVGYVIVLVFMFVAFEWSKRDVRIDMSGAITENVFEQEIEIPITEQPELVAPPPPQAPAIAEVLTIVDDNDNVKETAIASSEEIGEAVIIKPISPTVDEEIPVEDEIFEVVEKNPEFSYNGMSLMQYLGKSIKYPTIAQETGTQGRVIVQFVVNKDGSIVDVKVVRGVDPYLNKEAIRVISTMPKWKPGTQKGEAVRVKYTVPVMFRLTEDNTQVKYAPIESKIDEMVVVGYAPEEATYPEEVTVFEVVEKMPEYPGGMSAMMAFISKNIKYPVAAQKAKIQGRVVIQFIVDKEGNIICPRVIRGADPLLDAEAIRLTTIMPKWKPGMQRGQAVNVKYTVPIMFRLQEPEKNPAVQNATVTPTK